VNGRAFNREQFSRPWNCCLPSFATSVFRLPKITRRFRPPIHRPSTGEPRACPGLQAGITGPSGPESNGLGRAGGAACGGPRGVPCPKGRPISLSQGNALGNRVGWLSIDHRSKFLPISLRPQIEPFRGNPRSPARRASGCPSRSAATGGCLGDPANRYAAVAVRPGAGAKRDTVALSGARRGGGVGRAHLGPPRRIVRPSASDLGPRSRQPR